MTPEWNGLDAGAIAETIVFLASASNLPTRGGVVPVYGAS